MSIIHPFYGANSSPGPSADAPDTSWFIAWIIGVDPRRLAMYSPESRMLAMASAYLLMVSLSISFMAVIVFCLESAPAGWLMSAKLAAAIAAGLAWVMIIGTVDRTLLIVSDAIGPGKYGRKALMLSLRLGMALIFSSIFADQLILGYYRSEIATAAHRLEFDERLADGSKLREFYKIGAKEGNVEEIGKELSGLRERRLVVPPEIRDDIAKVEKCDATATRMQARVASLQAQGADPDGIAAHRHDLYRQRLTCDNRRAKVEADKKGYFSGLDAQIAGLSTRLEAARNDLRDASDKMSREAEAEAAVSKQRHAGSGSRETAFEAAKRMDPEIARNALIMWTALVLLEMMPFLLKSLPTNHAVAAGTQAIHAEETAEQRARITQAQMQEAVWSAVWQRQDVLAAATHMAANHANALAPLFCYDAVLAAQVQAERKAKTAARNNPSMATTILNGYSEAVRQTYQNMAMVP